jgi:hypothetical protein
MTQDEIIAMATQVYGECDWHKSALLRLEAFVKLVEDKALAQRTWVGLTEQERNDIEDYCEMMIGKPAFDAIEAKLKQKNGFAEEKNT